MFLLVSRNLLLNNENNYPKKTLSNFGGTIYMITTIKSIKWTLLNSTSIAQVNYILVKNQSDYF